MCNFSNNIMEKIVKSKLTEEKLQSQRNISLNKGATRENGERIAIH